MAPKLKFRIQTGNDTPVSNLKTDEQRDNFQLNRDSEIVINRFKEVIEERGRKDDSEYYDYNTAWMITSCRKNFYDNHLRDYHSREDMQSRFFATLCKKRNGNDKRVAGCLFSIYLMEQLGDVYKVNKELVKDKTFRLPDQKLDQILRTVIADMQECITVQDTITICGDCIKQYKENGSISI